MKREFTRERGEIWTKRVKKEVYFRKLMNSKKKKEEAKNGRKAQNVCWKY